MTGWVVLVDHARDFPNAETPHKVITTRDYLARPKLFAGPGRAEDHQSVPLLQLPVEGLLRLAAGRSARASHHPDGRDDARASRAQALRTRAARPAGGVERGGRPLPRQRGDDFRRPVLFRTDAGRALRGVRAAVVRLVSLSRAGSDDHAGQILEDRPPPGAPARQARAGGGVVLPRRAATAHRARLAQSACARRRQILARRAL